MPTRIAFGRLGHAATTALNSGSFAIRLLWTLLVFVSARSEVLASPPLAESGTGF